jgi:hypothetical protein
MERERVKISKGASTVLVASKLPNSHLLQLHEMHEVPEGSPTGTRMVKKAVKVGEPVRLNGSRTHFGVMPNHPVLPQGYGLTKVDREFWETWLKQNKDSDAIQNGIIFAYEGLDGVEGRAKENAKAGVLSGLEPINPARLKEDKRIAGIGKIQSYAQDKAG